MLASALDDTVVSYWLASSKRFDVWFTALNGVDLQEASTHEWRGKGWHEGDACTDSIANSIILHCVELTYCLIRVTLSTVAGTLARPWRSSATSR